MATNDLLALSATELAGRIARRQVSSLEIVDAHIARIEHVNPLINAVVATNFERARRQARAADERTRRAGDPLPPFHGVPFTVKELIRVAGFPFTAGVVARRHEVATDDAPLVARLKAAGGIVLGVTNVSEAGLWLETHNKVYGRTNNPHDLGRTAGGSSGGEAAIIAAGGSPMGIGADIGGSIRNPSFFNGICGHKPTGGLLPSAGHWPPTPGGRARLCVSGPMGRAVGDLEAMMEVFSPEQDPYRVPGRPAFTRLRDLSPRDVNVFYFVGSGLGRVDSEVRTNVLGLTGALRGLGFRVSEWRPDGLLLGPAIWGAMVASTAEQSVAELIGNGERVSLRTEWLRAAFGRSRHPLYTLLMASLEGVTRSSAAVTARLVARAARMRAAIEDKLGPRGVLVCLPYPRPAPRHDVPLLAPLAFSECGIFNALELPATAVPTGQTTAGLPIGVQVVARRFDDALALWVAARIEEISGPFAPVDPSGGPRRFGLLPPRVHLR